MNPYERYLLPRLTHWVCNSTPVNARRQMVVPRARGRVLEVGFGSGLNLPYYNRERVEYVWALEPMAQMRALAAPRISASGIDVRILAASAEALPLPDQSVDTVVTTFTLCTIPDVRAALVEFRRVLQPPGELLFCEHGAAPNPGVRRWQDRLDGVWGHVAGGCHLNREIAPLIQAAGFQLEDAQSAYLPQAPRLAGYNTWGVATVKR